MVKIIVEFSKSRSRSRTTNLGWSVMRTHSGISAISTSGEDRSASVCWGSRCKEYDHSLSWSKRKVV
jgi:hypothetical protein